MIRQPRQALKDLSKSQKVNRIFGYVVFLTVFVFTFCWTAKEIRENKFAMLVFLGTFAGLVFLEIILWIILYFVFKRQSITPNDKNIQQVIAQNEQEELEELTKKK